MFTATLTKISHLKEPVVDTTERPLQEDTPVSCAFHSEPDLNKPFYFEFFDKDQQRWRLIMTTPLQKLHIQTEMGSGPVTLPKGFPEPVKFNIPELSQSDVIFATDNSMYWLHNIRPLAKKTSYEATS